MNEEVAPENVVFIMSDEILEITFFSLKGVIPFLLLNAFSCVLTGAFCQADL